MKIEKTVYKCPKCDKDLMQCDFGTNTLGETYIHMRVVYYCLPCDAFFSRIVAFLDGKFSGSEKKLRENRLILLKEYKENVIRWRKKMKRKKKNGNPTVQCKTN